MIMVQQRDIKFRVWDTHNQKMVDPNRWSNDLVMDMDGELKWYKEREYQGGSLDLSGTASLVLMQYTGLKDVNGREVYEGDIIEAKQWAPMCYAVEFIEGAFCFTNPKLQGSPIDINLMYSSLGCAFEVIGNIYENPELTPA